MAGTARRGNGDSVLLENWYSELSTLDNDRKNEHGLTRQTILEIRASVSKELEPLRADKTIGSSLDAE